MLCACVAGSSTPVTKIFADGNAVGELGDERDRATDSGVDGLGAPRLPERRTRRVVDRSAGVDGVRLADVAGRDGHLRTPRRVLLEVACQRRQVFFARHRPARRAC